MLVRQDTLTAGPYRWRREMDHEQQVRALWIANGTDPADRAIPQVFYAYNGTGGTEVLHALIGREEWEPADWRWHISISGPDRVPTWGEVAAACHALRPGVLFVMGVPPRSQWMNVHKDVLHCWETKDRAMLEQWRINSRGDTPS